MSDEKKLDDRGRPVISAAERAANKVFKKVDAEKAMNEHETAQKAVYDNRDRLRAERLAREANDLQADE